MTPSASVIRVTSPPAVSTSTCHPSGPVIRDGNGPSSAYSNPMVGPPSTRCVVTRPSGSYSQRSEIPGAVRVADRPSVANSWRETVPSKPDACDAAAFGVERPGQAPTLVVHHPDEPAGPVVLVDVDRPVLGVGHHRPVPDVVAEQGLPPERRHLGQDPALVVVGVAAQPHAVGVPHLDDATVRVHLVAAVPDDPLGADQVAPVVVAVAGRPPARPPHLDHAGPRPRRA